MAGRNAPSRASYDDDDDWYGSDKVKAVAKPTGNKAADKTGSKYPAPALKPDPNKDKNFLSTKPNPAAKKTTGYKSHTDYSDDDDDDDFQGIKPVNKYSNKKPAARAYDDDDDDDFSFGGKNYQKTKGHYDDDDDDWDPKKPKKNNPPKPGDKKRGSFDQDSDDDWDHGKKKFEQHHGHNNNGKKEDEEYIYLKIAVVKKDGRYDLHPLDNDNEPIPPIIRKDGSKLYTKKSPSNSPDYHNGRTQSRLDDKSLTPYDKAQRRNSYDPYASRAASPLPDLRNIRSSGYSRTEPTKSKSHSWLDTFTSKPSQPSKPAPAKPNQQQQARR